MPLVAHLLFGQFIDERTERVIAMSLCLRLVAMDDEMHVYGEPTEGMQMEIAEAERLGIPVVRVELP